MNSVKATNLKFCLINAENLFLMFDVAPESIDPQLKEFQWQRLSSSVYENKSLKKTLDLAFALKEIDADIIMLCEVGGTESLKNFNRYFMFDQYETYLVEGNSDRNIDVGFMVRKSLGAQADLTSNKYKLINYLYPHERQSLASGYPVKNGQISTSHRFSRDVAELRISLKKSDDETDEKTEKKPDLILLLTHLKSRLDPERIDPNGFERRQAELKALLEIYKEISLNEKDVPIFVAGDFNGNASSENTDEEFKELHESSDLKDIFDLCAMPLEERATYYQVRSGSRTDGKQIDFVFASPEAQKILKGDSPLVYRYKDERGLTFAIPKNMDLKSKLPSDHYPILFEIENLHLR